MNQELNAQKTESILREVWHYIRTKKKYWLIPLIIVFVIFGALLIIAQTVPIVSPFIYTLF